MSFVPLVVGLISSSSISFVVLQSITDRRILCCRKVDANNLRREIYQQRLDRLLLQERRASITEDPLTAQAKAIVNNKVVPSISQSVNYLATISSWTVLPRNNDSANE